VNSFAVSPNRDRRELEPNRSRGTDDTRRQPVTLLKRTRSWRLDPEPLKHDTVEADEPEWLDSDYGRCDFPVTDAQAYGELGAHREWTDGSGLTSGHDLQPQPSANARCGEAVCRIGQRAESRGYLTMS